jgi:Flp pilus assembly protein TadD
LYTQHREEEALSEFHRALKLDPRNTMAHATLGAVLRNRGQREEAITEYRRAIALDPGVAAMHAILGTLLSEQAMSEEATAELQRARDLDPHLANTLYTLSSEFVKQALRSASASGANATLIDACWLLVTAKHLAPADADYRAAMRRIDRRLGGRQTCPPRLAQVNARGMAGSNTEPFQAPRAH